MKGAKESKAARDRGASNWTDFRRRRKLRFSNYLITIEGVVLLCWQRCLGINEIVKNVLTGRSTNVLQEHSEPMTSHVFGGQPEDADAYIERRANVMAAVLKVWRHIKNLTSPIDAYRYLLGEQFFQISSRSDLKLRSFRLFKERHQARTRTR